MAATCGHRTAELTTKDGRTFCSVKCAEAHFGNDVNIIKVGFSITQSTGMLERTIGWWYGGFGAAHQYITEQAVGELIPADQAKEAKRLTAGVIWNDFPSASPTDPTYQDDLVPISDDDAPYIEDARFRWQPSERVRYANAGAYKSAGPLSNAIYEWKGVSEDDLDDAKDTIERRTDYGRTHYHFLRMDERESDQSVRDRAINTCLEWYRIALETGDLFTLGHMFHTIQDSYSPAHTKRTAPGSKYDYGRITRVYYFGDQSDTYHSNKEGIKQVLDMNNEAHDRVEWCVRALNNLYLLFLGHRKEVVQNRANPAVLAARMEQTLKDTIWQMSA